MEKPIFATLYTVIRVDGNHIHLGSGGIIQVSLSQPVKVGDTLWIISKGRCGIGSTLIAILKHREVLFSELGICSEALTFAVLLEKSRTTGFMELNEVERLWLRNILGHADGCPHCKAVITGHQQMKKVA